MIRAGTGNGHSDIIHSFRVAAADDDGLLGDVSGLDVLRNRQDSSHKWRKISAMSTGNTCGITDVERLCISP